MSTLRLFAGLTVLTAALVMYSLPAAAGSYTATIIQKDGGFESVSKLYVSGDNYRLEPEAEYEPVIIGRLGDDEMYTVDRLGKSYTKDFFRKADLPYILFPLRPKKRVNIGKDTVKDLECTKAEVTVEDEYGNERKEIRWYGNYSRKLQKVALEDEDWSETLTDVDPGRLDESLFEPPADYQAY